MRIFAASDKPLARGRSSIVDEPVVAERIDEPPATRTAGSGGTTYE